MFSRRKIQSLLLSRALVVACIVLGTPLLGSETEPDTTVATSEFVDCNGGLIKSLLTQRPAGFHEGFIVIVDPISEGKFIAPNVWKHKYRPIYVMSRERYINGLEKTLRTADFAGGFNLVYPGEKFGDYDRLLNSLKSLNEPIVGVIPGSEYAPQLTARLARDLKVRGNDYDRSDLWSDKYLMGKALEAEGMATPATTLASNSEQALNWVESVHGSWPVIVKPRDGMASYGVFKCNDKRDLDKAFKSLIGKPSPRGGTITDLMVQEFIDPKEAEEYIVEVEMTEGMYKVGYMEKYELVPVKSRALTWEFVDMLTPDGEIQDFIIAQAIKATRAVGLSVGVAHWEIYVKVVNGKRIAIVLDLGARTGGGMHAMTTMGTNHDIVDANILAHVDPVAFAALPDRYQQKAHVRHVGLNVWEDGMIMGTEEEILAELKKLASFKEYRPFAADGKRLGVTIDLLSMSGWIFLAHENKAQVIKDHDRILELKDAGLFFRRGPATAPQAEDAPATDTDAPATSSTMPPTTNTAMTVYDPAIGPQGHRRPATPAPTAPAQTRPQ